MNSNTLTDQQAACYHCGEACAEDIVRADTKVFCCQGCKLVFELLEENKLGNYYCLEAQPGISFKKYQNGSRFEYLDDPEVVEQVTDFKNRDFVSVTIYIPNIHCTSCVWLLENIYKLDDGITKSSVNFLKRELSFSYKESKTSLRKIVELLSSIGYEPELRLENLAGNDKGSDSLSSSRRLWLKVGVAGFAFGNIMLFSFPEYLSGSTLNTQGSFHTFFGILNIVLALPVVFYSAIDYLKSAWAALKQYGVNLDVPISMGILALFLRSVYEIASGIGAGYMDSLTGLVFFLLIGRIIQKKTYERLSFDRDYKSYLPISVTTLGADGSEKSIPINKLNDGTHILIRDKQLVPADARLLSEKCFIDYSFITGESEPVQATRGETIFAGGKVIGTSAKMSTIKEVSSSYLTRLWNDAAFDKAASKPVVSTLADRISPYFTAAVLIIAFVAGLFWWQVSVEMGITVFSAVLIIACPCALALSTPFTLGSALNIFSRNGLYIKGIEVIERLANATSIVFDKTGTLTKSERASVRFHGEAVTDQEFKMINAVCHQSLHPLSQKITQYLGSPNGVAVSSYEEILSRGIRAKADGRTMVIGSSAFIEEQIGKDLTGISTPGSAASTVHVAIDGQWRGVFEISNRYRKGVRELLEQLKGSVTTFLISGDNDAQKQDFLPFFEKSALRFNQSPQQKLDFIRQLQKESGNVVMIGDGLNDAGALQQSDFGIALTDDVNAFTPACDAILDGKFLGKLNRFIDFSQVSIRVIKLSFVLSLLYNVVGLAFAVAGQLSPLVAAILMPLSSISIMIFTTAGTHLAAKKRGLLTWK